MVYRFDLPTTSKDRVAFKQMTMIRPKFWFWEVGLWNSEMRAEIMGLKEGMLELKEIKEKLRDIKKWDIMSEGGGGESSLNGDERREER